MNSRVIIKQNEVLSDNWYVLRKFTFDYQNKDGTWGSQSREAYDRGNGATILLYNRAQQTVILTRQFRLPTYINGNESGMLIETCAGLLDKDSPEECIRRETEEETGYHISQAIKVGEAYMSPGSVTELLHFFVAEYTKDMLVNGGGGLVEEQENIEVLELDFADALEMIKQGEIKDGKTIMLLQYAQLNDLIHQPKEPMHILIAGPYRSGTGDDPVLIAANVQFMNEMALKVYRAGHLPVLGEWYALPLIETAGSEKVGDAVFQEIFHPSSMRLIKHCDVVLRVGGPSAGADEMVRLGTEQGKKIYYGFDALFH